MSPITRWGIACLALLLTIHVVPGIRLAGEPGWILAATLALSFLNACARPLVWLMRLLTLPLSCLTLGLWGFFVGFAVNTLIFYFVGRQGWGFRVDGWTAAALGALIMSVVSAILVGLSGLGGKR